ncbi:MAG: hypothetical protein JSV43_06165 [Methanobacteriota archaeon]|nr:MAG: hypothetical protein JSV43_06165 [Euryarchaeota archaeon]
MSLDRNHKLLTGLLTGCLFLVLFCAHPSEVEAAFDTVETYDSTLFLQTVSVFGDGGMVYVLASDGVSFGGNVSASVFDEAFPDQIMVMLYDNGSGPGDVPNDGEYTGNFTIRYDGGVSGTFTDDLLDIIDLADGTNASIIVDIDGLGDFGTAQVTGDFSIPLVTINSISETVDTSYTLNATIIDMNMDTGNVWYQVDGGPNQRFFLAGGNDYESIVDTSGLLDGPHTITVIAYDLAGNLNDTESVTIFVSHPPPPAPDLSILVTLNPPSPKEGDTVTITATIENNGDADANNAAVSLIIDTLVLHEETVTIPIGETRIVETNWKADEGSHEAVALVLVPAMAPATSTLQFEVQSAGDLLDILMNPWVILVIIVLIAVIMIGGTVGWAYLGKEAAKAKAAKPVPVTPTTIPPEAKDPCEEIRRKWKAVVAEYERSLLEMEGAQKRAWKLRDSADDARSRADKARSDADNANQSIAQTQVSIEDAKRNMHDFFGKGLLVEGISVGTPKAGEAIQTGYFKGLVNVYFRNKSFGQIANKYVQDNREAYDDLQNGYDGLQNDLAQAQAKAGAANQTAAQAEAAATAAENRARTAEQEFENIKTEVRSLKKKGEAFRQKWRVCNLDRLREAATEIEQAAAEAEEIAKRAQGADSAAELEEHKKNAEKAKSKADEANDKAKDIKKKLQDEDIEEEIEEIDTRFRKASGIISSAISNIADMAGFFVPQTSELGKPCKGGETKVLNEYTMQYQFFDPTREIVMPHFYAVQSGGPSGEAFAEYLMNVGEICERAKGVIGQVPGGDLIGIPLEYWTTIKDAGGAALKKMDKKSEAKGYIKLAGLAIPTVQITVTCQELMVCKEGTWHKERRRISETPPMQSWIGYPHDPAVPANEAIQWVQSRLESLSTQQKNYLEKPCG